MIISMFTVTFSIIFMFFIFFMIIIFSSVIMSVAYIYSAVIIIAIIAQVFNIVWFKFNFILPIMKV